MTTKRELKKKETIIVFAGEKKKQTPKLPVMGNFIKNVAIENSMKKLSFIKYLK